MPWNLKENKKPVGQQDIKLKQLLKEMAEYSYATYSGEFESHFKILIKDLPKTNNFSADLMYKVTQRNLKSVEVWKLTTKGDFKHKMYTLDFI